MSVKGKLTFRGWLWEHLEDESQIGDLARDAKQDSEWVGRSAASLEDRLNALGACFQAKETLKDAKRIFRAQ